MAGNTDIALHRKIAELGDEYDKLEKQYKKLRDHYYSVKVIYKDKVKEVVQNHSEAFNLDTKEKLINDLQRLFFLTESAPISVPSVPSDPSVPHGTRFVGNPGESQAVPQVPRVIGRTIPPLIVPKAFQRRSGRSGPYS